MPRDITVHFVGNARDLAASSAIAEASVDRFGNATAIAGAKAEAASFGFYSLLLPLIALAAALVIVTAPITVLATTFGGLAAGVVALAVVTGNAYQAWQTLTIALQQAAAHLGELAEGPAIDILTWLTSMIPMVEELGVQLIGWFGERLPAMLPIITQIAQGLVAMILALASAWGAMVDFFMAHWVQYSTAIGSVFSAIGTGVHFVLPLLGLLGALFQALGPAIQFVRDHADSLKPVLYAIGAILIVVVAVLALFAASCIVAAGVVTALAAALSFAVRWVIDTVQWLGHLIDKAGGVVGAIQAIGRAISSLPNPAGAVAQFFGGGRQSGGPVLPGGVYTVGEAGPETLVMGGGGGYVVPGRTGGGVGSTYNISVSVSPLASPADTGRAVVQAIQEYERRGSKGWRT